MGSHGCIVQRSVVTFCNIQTPINPLFCDEAHFMLFKFKSKATGDLIMLEPNGRRVLQIIGKDPSTTGIILPDQMPAAIDALQVAIAREEAAIEAAKLATKEAGKTAGKVETNAPSADAVPLRQRALPFIELLKKCHSAKAEIVWGV